MEVARPPTLFSNMAKPSKDATLSTLSHSDTNDLPPESPQHQHMMYSERPEQGFPKQPSSTLHLGGLQLPLFAVDVVHGHILEWNSKLCELTGWSLVQVHGTLVDSFLSFGHGGDTWRSVVQQPQTTCSISIQAKEGSVAHFLARIVRHVGNDGEEAAVFLLEDLQLDAENSNGGTMSTNQLTHTYSNEEALELRQAIVTANELRLLIDSFNAPIFGVDCNGEVNEWNDKTTEMTGYTKGEAFGSHLVQTFIAPAMQSIVQDVLSNALEGRSTSIFDLDFQTKYNETRHLLVNATTRRDSEGRVIGVVGVAQDVTEAVQRDRAVASMALELRLFIETANAPIFGVDIDGNVNEFNKRMQEITGYTKEETFDKPLVEKFIAPSMRDRVQEVLEHALRGNETSNYELEFVSKSGEPRYMLVNATTRRDPEFNVVGVVGVAQDVTEDRKHAEELQKMQYVQVTQEAKVETERNMTAYFAHELRNPLGAIDSALNAMPDDLPESVKSLVAGMNLCTSFMSSIMNNLLDVRKMEEGKMKLNKAPMSLSGLLKTVHAMLLPSLKPGVEFIQESHTQGSDWVAGDEHRMQQVLTNVCTNAIKYTNSGSIRIRMSWEGPIMKFECIDTGPGIPKSAQEKMFQRFVQRGGAPGTGLGLAIAKHLVELSGGDIKFISDPSVKPGTTCIVRMPLDTCDASLPDVSEVPGEAGMLQDPLRFLIIDDVEMNRKMFQRRIQRGIAPNCTIEEASSGEEALSICAIENFDVIIVDQYMEEAGGVMVGTDVVYAMRRMNIASIIIGCSGNDLEKEFQEAGADWVWQKPMPTNDKIISHLRTLLKERH